MLWQLRYLGKKRNVTTAFSSVVQMCPTLCNPMDCSTTGLPVHHQLPELTQTHVHWVGDAIQPSHPLSSPSPPAFNIFSASGSFPMSQFFTSGGQSIGASASASVLRYQLIGAFSKGPSTRGNAFIHRSGTSTRTASLVP